MLKLKIKTNNENTALFPVICTTSVPYTFTQGMTSFQLKLLILLLLGLSIS